MISKEEKELTRLYNETMRKLEKDYRITQAVLRGEFEKEWIKLKAKKWEAKNEQDSGSVSE